MNAPATPGWIARILLTLGTLTLVVLGFFFLTIALAVGAVVALVIGVRLWWTLRKLKKSSPVSQQTPTTRNDTVVDGEYRVIEHGEHHPAPAHLPKTETTPRTER